MNLRPLVRIAASLILVSRVAPAQHSQELQFASAVDRQALLGTVRALTSLGNRLGGTPSGNRAASYVAGQFQRVGLNPAIVEDPDRLVYVNQGWELRVERPRSLRDLIRFEWLGGFSPSAKRQTVRLRFFDGEEENRYDSCAVLTPVEISENVYRQLCALGARCIISYAPGDSTMYRNSAMITELPADTTNRIPLFNISYSNGRKLRDELKGGTEVRIRFRASSKIVHGNPRTVLARLKGKSNKYFVVCAHGDADSGGPGADDNASGVAGVLEIARILKAMVREKRIPPPQYGILFAVWGTEYASSSAFIRSRRDSLDEIMGVLNYDQIGTGATRNCVYFESNEVPHNAPLLKVLQSVAEEYAGKRGFWEEATTNPSQGGTDSYAFLPAYMSRMGINDVKIPSVTVYTAAWNSSKTIPQTEGWESGAWKGPRDSVTIDYSPYYHSSRDIPELTTEREPFNMSNAVKAVGIALLRLAW